MKIEFNPNAVKEITIRVSPRNKDLAVVVIKYHDDTADIFDILLEKANQIIDGVLLYGKVEKN